MVTSFIRLIGAISSMPSIEVVNNKGVEVNYLTLNDQLVGSRMGLMDHK